MDTEVERMFTFKKFELSRNLTLSFHCRAVIAELHIGIVRAIAAFFGEFKFILLDEGRWVSVFESPRKVPFMKVRTFPVPLL